MEKLKYSFSWNWACGGTKLACLVMAFVSLLLSSQPASAQVTYRYTGNRFTGFVCGLRSAEGKISDCSEGGPVQNPYTTDDFVSATLTLDESLPGNLNLQDITGFAGFKLTMNDGQQELTPESALSGARVSTDAAGNIIEPWDVGLIGVPPNNAIITQNLPNATLVVDVGVLSNISPGFPNLPYIAGGVLDDPGVWVVSSEAPLSANPSSLSFSFAQGAEAAIRGLIVSNTSSDSLPFQVAVTTQTGGPWLSLTAGPDDPAPIEDLVITLTVTADPIGLAPGTYSGARERYAFRTQPRGKSSLCR